MTGRDLPVPHSASAARLVHCDHRRSHHRGTPAVSVYSTFNRCPDMSHTHPFIAKLAVVSLLVSPGGPFAGWQTAAAAPAKAAKSVAAVPPTDGGWPRAYTTAHAARVVLYQPQ